MKSIARTLRLPLLVVGALVAGSACQTYSSYVFEPAVRDVEVRAPDETVLARVLVSPRGIKAGELGPTLRFRLRVENRSEDELELLASESQLFDAALTRFDPVTIAPDIEGGPDTFLASFPFPPDTGPRSMDLRTLHLRLGIRHGDRILLPSVNFQRVYRHYDPYGPRYSIGIGYGWYCD